jgi:hypothetical protein
MPLSPLVAINQINELVTVEMLVGVFSHGNFLPRNLNRASETDLWRSRDRFIPDDR